MREWTGSTPVSSASISGIFPGIGQPESWLASLESLPFTCGSPWFTCGIAKPLSSPTPHTVLSTASLERPLAPLARDHTQGSVWMQRSPMEVTGEGQLCTRGGLWDAANGGWDPFSLHAWLPDLPSSLVVSGLRQPNPD